MPTVRKLSTSVSLPSEPNCPPENFDDYNSMFYGRKQWGKSTIASQYPSSYNFQFEPSRRGLKILQVAVRSIEQADNYLESFLESEYKRVVIDTVDRFYDMHLVSTCLELSKGSKKHPSQFGDEGYAIWDIVKTRFECYFETLIDAGKNFTIISHDKKVNHKHRDGTEWVRIEPTCKPAAWKIGQSMCDFVFHCDFISGKRVVTVRDLDNSTMASCNPEINCFMDVDGKPLNRFVIPNENSRSYAGLLEAFNNKLHDFTYEPPARPLTRKTDKSTISPKKKKILATS